MNPLDVLGQSVKNVGNALGNLFISTTNSHGAREATRHQMQEMVHAATQSGVSANNISFISIQNLGSGCINVYLPDSTSPANQPPGKTPFASINDAWSVLPSSESLAGIVITSIFSYGLSLYWDSLSFHSSTVKKRDL